MQFLKINTVGFPGLGIEFNINPVAFNLFGKDIYWYGIIIAVGFALALWYALSQEKRVGFPKDTVTDLVLLCVPVAIICARIYFVAFKWSDYAGDFLKMIAIWDGGIAIYGGLIGGFATGLIYCRVKKLNFYQVADVVAPSILIGQAIGRFGNFVNAEAHGGITALPWRMSIVEATGTFCYHPTFLYESLWNITGFVILHLLRKKKPFDGFFLWAYVLWYGLGRVWIEGLRTDSLMLGNLRISQIVAGVCIIVSAVVIIIKWKKSKCEG